MTIPMNAKTIDVSADADAARAAATQFNDVYQRIRVQVGKAIVGQDEVVEGVLIALLAGGHVLLEGVPGLGKTMLVRSLAAAVDLHFSRIQFTPDMMPADIQGTMMLVENASGGHELTFQAGPVVANLVLADEINRATPKTQSALLEAMQEGQVTVGKRSLRLPEPYCVMATQNPVEQEGTYPLPEAQLDRFLLKLVVGYPREEDYRAIAERTTGTRISAIAAVSNAEEISRMRLIVRAVPVPELALMYAIRLVMGTQPNGPYSCAAVNELVALGSSPRGMQALLLAAKVKALLDHRYAVSIEDVRAVALSVLRHRIMINFQAQSAGVTCDEVVKKVLANVKAPHGTDR
jgi:MoxR-like ATPase